MIRLALKSALSDRAANDRVIVLDWGLDAPSTKGAIAALAANGVTGRALVVLRQEDEVVWKSLRNLGDVHVRSEEHTSELQSLMRISYAVFCLKKKKHTTQTTRT